LLTLTYSYLDTRSHFRLSYCAKHLQSSGTSIFAWPKSVTVGLSDASHHQLAKLAHLRPTTLSLKPQFGTW
jgi:hypothetical protein